MTLIGIFLIFYITFKVFNPSSFKIDAIAKDILVVEFEQFGALPYWHFILVNISEIVSLTTIISLYDIVFNFYSCDQRLRFKFFIPSLVYL
jgi:hypothetical protein